MTVDERDIDVVVDGADKACGELLLELHSRLRESLPGTRVRLLALDPAAPIDIPAWCHLTGHLYLGRVHASDPPAYDLEVGSRPRGTERDSPWRLVDTATLTEMESS